ncbi:uncharacterized protein FFUJ_00339 [Fusarium fujikuroi IMI 58289]|uniref:Uncharacterized protein n=1 Tax=Gibberella fujikuroi (strain CBS 195.34 / IMI 58289 / NRRL A-6831) TaxID=1279085 RepID=S0DKY4_GIBF5|nr:uncharacterized protein FFUJ_00339 [Fusarium fujikuroi IMI 58289]KLP16104.1 uncharacterized protein LW94_6530 [Fusarium fujikuroi]CCT63051.1 uncharacterized protein FFUJ_00339 [Fusarium fujikuroi IMI 58289]SCN72230.1 uncharacterized protein FFM5_00351 [Fusarium fujikuroi]SCO30519.1 uncharacterized protein FFMR_01841 [Fusarium fujikuroi]
MDLDQPVDPPDSSQAQDVAERGTSADPEPRVFNICGLCKFRLHGGQAIITVDRSNSTLPLTWDDKYYPENEILRPYGQKTFHTGCFQIAGDVVFAKGFLESCTWNLVKFRFHYDSFTQPPPSFVARRARRLRSSLSLAIRHAIKNRLPIEVCENIAAYCLSEYATNLHLDAWQRRDPSGPNKDVTLPIFNGQTIWAQYVEIEGRNYVKSLSTARMNENDTMAFMVKPKPNSWMGLKMYFTEDSLGVRSVIASSDDGIQSTEEPGLRWISIPSKTYNIPFYIRMDFDGLKLRNLDVTQYEREHHYEQRARWAMFPRDLGHPNAPPDNIETGHGAAVHAVDWNLPGVSVPYRSGKLSPALLDAYANAGLVCLYFPVDPDERISKLWLRSGDFPCDDDDALTRAESLIVATSSRRSLVLGPDIRSRSSHSNRPLNYEALADLPSTTSARTFYYKYTNTESWLGFEKTTTWHERKIKLSFGPPARPGPYDWPDRFFSTSAELENLQTITPCRGWGDCVDNEIFGLLFTYTDGRQRSVGQIRLDHLQDSINISDKFWLGSSGDTEPDDEEPYSPTGHITWLGVCKPVLNSDMNMQYLEIPLRGKLEWRSTWGTVPTESDVLHLGSEACKLQSEMDQVLAHEASSGTASKTAVKTFSVHTGDMCFYEEENGL